MRASLRRDTKKPPALAYWTDLDLEVGTVIDTRQFCDEAWPRELSAERAETESLIETIRAIEYPSLPSRHCSFITIPWTYLIPVGTGQDRWRGGDPNLIQSSERLAVVPRLGDGENCYRLIPEQGSKHQVIDEHWIEIVQERWWDLSDDDRIRAAEEYLDGQFAPGPINVRVVVEGPVFVAEHCQVE